MAEVGEIISVQLLLQRSMSGREWMITCSAFMAHGFLCSGEIKWFPFTIEDRMNYDRTKKDGILQLEGKNMGWKDLDFGFKYQYCCFNHVLCGRFIMNAGELDFDKISFNCNKQCNIHI